MQWECLAIQEIMYSCGFACCCFMDFCISLCEVRSMTNLEWQNEYVLLSSVCYSPFLEMDNLYLYEYLERCDFAYAGSVR